MTTDTLDTTTLGRSGLKVTRLGYGAMELRGSRVWGGRPIDSTQADTILSAVLDSGINWIDTSGDYGTSEKLIGELIADRRDEYTLATKCGCTIVPAGDHDETPHDFSREHMLGNIDTSLRLMNTDHIDILQVHNPTVEQAEEFRIVDTLREIKESGKVGVTGISTRSPDLATFIDWNVFDVIQIPYSALERKHENLIQRAHDSGAGTIIRSAAPRSAAGGGLGKEERLQTWQRAGLDELLEAGESRGRWMTRYMLSHPGIDTIIIGTLSPDHLAENIADVAAGPLAPDVYAEAKRRLDEAGESPEDA
jgi:aryl-alcohol dehydrogenase-like predicted oxidoreductase